MKKHFGKILCGVLGLGFLLTGCATVGNISNSNPELIYNGNSAVMVDGYLYYGNSFSDVSTITNDGDYKNSAKLSYLARLNTNIELAAEDKNHSPEKIENVTAEVVSHSKSFSFVLGNYIYYATPKREKMKEEGGVQNYYTYSTLYRSKLNGDKKDKVYTTDGEVTQIEALKFDGKYYIVMLAGTKLVKIEVGNEVGKAQVINDVTSIAIPKTYAQDRIGSSLDWNGYIFYTQTKSDEDNSDVTGTKIYRLSAKSNSGECIDEFSKDLKFVGREKDVLFYSLNNEIFSVESSSAKNIFRNSTINKKFYTADTISDIKLIATENVDYGYVFTNSSSKLMYADRTSTRQAKFMSGTEEVSTYKTLFVSGTTAYIATTTGIYSADLTQMASDGTVDCITLVKMTAIYDGVYYAYDGEYIYYYAQLEALESEDTENSSEETTEEEGDKNYYMYRVKAHVNPSVATEDAYELISMVQERK